MLKTKFSARELDIFWKWSPIEEVKETEEQQRKYTREILAERDENQTKI
jgi:hypothetical protein